MILVKKCVASRSAIDFAVKSTTAAASCKDDKEPHAMICSNGRGVQRRSYSGQVPDTKTENNHRSTVKPFAEIPGPRGLPIVGTAFDYMPPNGKIFENMCQVLQKRAKEYGPIFKEKIGSLTTVVISDLDEYFKVIQVDGKFPKRLIIEPMTHYFKQKNWKPDIVSSQGEEWYRYRKTLSRKMLPLAEVAKSLEPMDQVGSDFVRLLHNLQAQASDHTVFDVRKETFKFAMESAGCIIFEERIGCLSDPIRQDAQDFINSVIGANQALQQLIFDVQWYKIYRTKAWRTFETNYDKVYELGRMFVEKKLEASQKTVKQNVEAGEQAEKSEFLTYLLSKKDLTIHEICLNVVGLLIAAVDTTSNTLIWTLYSLARNPDVQEAVRKEIDAVLPGGAGITNDSIQQLRSVKACLKEALRLYPVSTASSRHIAKDIECCGYHIPVGTHCQSNNYAMGRDERLFPDAERFQPQRWLRSENTEGRLNTLTSLVFGHGPRMCPGRRIAEQEVYIALTKILQNFKLEYHGDDVQPVMQTILIPDRPVNISFIPRVS